LAQIWQIGKLEGKKEFDMDWIEVITLRSLENIHGSLIPEILKPMTTGDENNGLIAMKIYRHAWIDTDVSIHFHWRSPKIEPRGTDTGLVVMQSLEKFGLVNHSAWVEEEIEAKTAKVD
jgi:hypothetical protein